MRKILIVDDDVRLLAITRKGLEATGLYEVQAVDSGRIALALAATFKPDLVILDVMMPGLDGGDVARTLSGSPATKNIPILFLTSLVSKEESTPHLRRDKGEQFLSKPVDPQELCRCVAELLL
jgi:CheY-like chemotaxis protein